MEEGSQVRDILLPRCSRWSSLLTYREDYHCLQLHIYIIQSCELLRTFPKHVFKVIRSVLLPRRG
jgi:hypothetical protein